MRCRCRLLLPAFIGLLGLITGCNYVHFGRIDRIRNESALASENSDLRVEKKLLKEELEIARKEREILTAAIDRTPHDTASEELVAKLNATNQQLLALREGYAQLKLAREQLKPTPILKRIIQPAAESPRTQQIAGLKDQLGKTEEKLADALRTHTELQGENARLRAELEAAHAENASLAARVEKLTTEGGEMRAALAQLNTVLVAEKAARAQAEEAAAASRVAAPTPAVVAPPASSSAPEPALSLASAREPSADAARELAATLQNGTLSAATSAVAAFATSPEKLAPAAGPQATTSKPPSTTPALGRTYTVRDGDSLEKIAEQLYGRRDRWILLYAANNTLLSEGRPLTPGMTLQVPDE